MLRFESVFFHVVDCLPGYYGIMDENARATCVVCRVGTYQPSSGQKACVECPDGFTTVKEGAMSLSQCKGSSKFYTFFGLLPDI